MQYIFSAFVFSLLVAIFAVQNSLPVTLTFMAWSFQLSLVVIILGAATFGALVILCLAMLVQFRLRRNLSKVRQLNGKLEAETTALKSKLEQYEQNAEKKETKS
ncbi:Hypothetical protein LUCI_1255 [Lucifera butyrica]|uniref:Lipopolysaccharide assembly protein A domain-containing protein n=1 Tax=Lucifera butyrica TaxID=1351585 RepID=A0A498R3R7_9FIRM|nr:lipopolysaccharide assembly protein LapA domain-containing protein [Lucifera butyrica]VBB06044.1 Hypothetical protein LUCI_1255 [Lucifera butyrica]